MIDPKSCASMEELRALIDAHDRELVVMLAHRMRCIDRAVELKQQVDWPARIDTRVDAVLENVRGAAGENALDIDLVDRLWRILIDWSIEREERILGPFKEDEGERGNH